LGLFGSLENTSAMQEYVYAHLKGENQPTVFGHQVIVNENDEVLGEDSHLLIGATELSLHDIAVKIHDLGGVCIASHVDRPAFGVINQLGFIPPDLLLDGVEVSYRVPLGEARKTIPGMMNLPCISSSDAHFPDDIGKVKTVFVLAAPTLAEIRLALKSQNGRRIIT
jgi:PHP family Zn ribbon phosphoesterase